MKRFSMETAVGVFVFIGLLCVAYLTVKLGKMELMGNDYYQVSAKFASVSGLKQGAIVDMAGVQIGKVDAITLDPEEKVAVVSLRIANRVPLSEDAIASVKTAGLIGDKYIKIEPGGSNVVLKDGGQILETESAIDLEQMISKYAFGDV